MASLMGAPGLFSFHSFILACTKRLYADGARLGLSSLSTGPSSVVCVRGHAYTDLVWRSWHWHVWWLSWWTWLGKSEAVSSNCRTGTDLSRIWPWWWRVERRVAATLCLWVVSGSRAVVSARGPMGKCRRRAERYFNRRQAFCFFSIVASRLNLPISNVPFRSFCTTGCRRRLRRSRPARSRRPHPPLRQDLPISGWHRMSLMHPAFPSAHPSISPIRSTTTPPPSVAPKSGTTSAIPQPRTRIRCARLPL